MSEPLDRDLIAAGCGGGIGSRVVVFRETESTNDIVRRAAEGGEVEGFVAFAESQKKGRGQFGRKWSSAPGLGLWFSVLLRPRWQPALLPQITPLAAVAIANALAGASGLDIRIKQPNDILCNGRKLAGILSEARTGGDVFVVVGIGINVNHVRADFPLELQASATSLALETGREWERVRLASVVLQALAAGYDPDVPPGEDILGQYAALSRGPVCDTFTP
jgi:BirA family biotin operon repressor/biotin-[acetyl-CoA-carboxylase] ligase